MSNHTTHTEKSYQDAAATSAQAMELMQQHSVAPTPPNYTLWYEYCNSSLPALRQRMEQHLNDNDEFTEELCKALYIEFFTEDHITQTLSSSEAVVKIATQVQTEAEHIGDHISDYGNLLKLSVEDLEQDTSFAAIKDLAQRLIQHSHSAYQESSASATALKNMSKEIERLTEELREASRAANTDPLTGIPNRRFFDNTFEELHSQAQQGTSLTCILADIDHFKSINDTYGHPVGDLVIRFIANLLVRAVGEAGVVARYGGEEFAILLADKRPGFGEELAENIRKAICRQELKSKEHGIALGQITASFGVSSYQNNDTVDSLINRADSNLYKAKQYGRNQVAAS